MHECLVSFKAIHHHHSVRKSLKKSQKRCTFLKDRAHALFSVRLTERMLYRAHAISSARFTECTLYQAHALPCGKNSNQTISLIFKDCDHLFSVVKERPLKILLEFLFSHCCKTSTNRLTRQIRLAFFLYSS